MNAKKGPKGKLKITQPHLPYITTHPFTHTHTHTHFIPHQQQQQCFFFFNFILYSIFQKSFSHRWLLDGHIVYHLFPYNFLKTTQKFGQKTYGLKGYINMCVSVCVCVFVCR